jgi:hypothetical protein
MQFPQGRLFELSGQGEQLIGKLKLALGAHFPEPLGLQVSDDGVNVLHGLNVGPPIRVNKSEFRSRTFQWIRAGTLVMLCLRDRGAWRIQSLLFSYHEGG